MSTEAQQYAGSHNIDAEKLKRLLPKGTNHKVTDEVINLIHAMEADTGLIQEYMEESLLSYLPVLREVKVELRDYVNAIKFCNLKKSMSNEKAWEIVFPDRYKKLVDEGRWNSSHVAMYNRSSLVVKLDAQMMVATHIQYAPMFHASVMKQFELMNGQAAGGMPVSATVQHLAASKLADLTAAPVEQKIDLKIGPSDEARSAQEKMFGEMEKIAKNQRALLEAGHKLEDIQRLNLKVEVEEDDGVEEYSQLLDDDDFIDGETDE